MSEYIVSFDGSENLAPALALAVASAGLKPFHEEIVRCRDCRHMFDWAYDVPMCKLWAKDGQDDSNASSGNALYPTVELDGYCWRGEHR